MPGQVFPMLIVWSLVAPQGSPAETPDTPVNGQVWLDGTDTHWVQKVTCGSQPGQFTWPPR